MPAAENKSHQHQHQHQHRALSPPHTGGNVSSNYVKMSATTHKRTRIHMIHSSSAAAFVRCSICEVANLPEEAQLISQLW